jgi:hypothetical protein
MRPPGCLRILEFFSTNCVRILKEHKKDIINQQLTLKRIADTAIDLYAQSAVISRASKALENKEESAEHEARVAALFLEKSTKRIHSNLAGLRSSTPLIYDQLVYAVANDIIDLKGYGAKHPLGF